MVRFVNDLTKVVSKELIDFEIYHSQDPSVNSKREACFELVKPHIIELLEIDNWEELLTEAQNSWNSRSSHNRQ